MVPGHQRQRPTLTLPCLMLVASRGAAAPRSLQSAVEAALAGGVTSVQLREPGMPARELYEEARLLRSQVAGKALLIINDRVDVALAVGADGVQLTGHSLPTPAARSLVGEHMLLGRSVHSAGEVAEAAAEADFAIIGTIFQTASHPGVAGAGLELVRAARATTDLPLIAIGGITAANAGPVMQAGADGVAVITAILGADNPEVAARQLRQAVDAGWHQSQRQSP